MYFFVGQHSGGVFKDLMVVIQAKLSFSIVKFIGIAIMMILQGFVS